MVGSSVACPRNHFYRTLEIIVAGCLAAGVVPVVRTQGDHCCDLADQLNLEVTLSIGRWTEHDALDQ